ncbi:MAG TPA: hypothetical protein VGC67_03585 [Cellulomonas sp.]
MTGLAGWIAQRRFDEHLVTANHDREAARALYGRDISVSAGFVELIPHVEARYGGRPGVEVGAFVAVDHRRRAGALDLRRMNHPRDIDDWFQENPQVLPSTTTGARSVRSRGSPSR